jgi:hypothetical protein
MVIHEYVVVVVRTNNNNHNHIASVIIPIDFQLLSFYVPLGWDVGGGCCFIFIFILIGPTTTILLLRPPRMPTRTNHHPPPPQVEEERRRRGGGQQMVRQHIQTSIQQTMVGSYDALPPWLQEYMTWHQQQMQSLVGFLHEQQQNHHHNRTTTTTAHLLKDTPYKLLIARCIQDIDTVCGGVSDRLKTLPTLFLLAYQSQRILLFHWSKPMMLEEFLLPTPYMNWSVPGTIIRDWFPS